MYEKYGIFTCQGRNPCGALLRHDKSSFIHPLMVLPMRLPMIFLSFISTAGKMQEKLTNKGF